MLTNTQDWYKYGLLIKESTLAGNVGKLDGETITTIVENKPARKAKMISFLANQGVSRDLLNKEKDNKEKDNKEKDNKEKDVEKTDGKETNGPLTEKTEGIGDPLDDLNLENTKTVDEKKETVNEKKEIVDKKKESIIEEVDDGFNLIHFSDEEKQIIEHGIEGKDEEDFHLLKDNVEIEKQQEKKSDGVKNQYVPGEENLEGTKLLGEKLKKDITVENKIAENKKSEELSIENEIKNLFPQKGNNNKEKNSLGIN